MPERYFDFSCLLPKKPNIVGTERNTFFLVLWHLRLFYRPFIFFSFYPASAPAGPGPAAAAAAAAAAAPAAPVVEEEDQLLRHLDIHDEATWASIKAKSSLDDSQIAAYRSALLNKIALIQVRFL